MKTLVFKVYDAFGDWISSNGMIRYLSQFYDQIYLVHDTPFVVPFTTHMFRDNPKIIPKQGIIESGLECDVIDLRVNESYPHPGNIGNYYNKNNRYGDVECIINDNASNFYSKLGIDPSLRITNFYYERDLNKEDEIYQSLNLKKDYSVICEMDNSYLNVNKDNIINIHRITDNFTHTLKIIEKAKEVHLIENSIALFVYHMQSINEIPKVPITLHEIGRAHV